MNLINSVRFYIDKIVQDPNLSGMKVLLLDAATTKIVSMVYTQTQILEQQVYLVEQLGKAHEAMSHMKAAVVLQPTEANVDMIIRELRDPKFSEYYLFFTNILPKDMLSRIAKADDNDVVRGVQEYYADYMSVNEDFFHLGADNSLTLSASQTRTLETSQLFDRNVNGVLSVLLSLKKRPSQIRYSAASDLCRRVATDVSAAIDKDDIFDFRREPNGPMLLFLDRRDDPITPLLTQWTYQAMVHELLGLNYNRVILRGAPNIKKELEEVILASSQDEFFSRNRYANFGDLGGAVKQLLDNYQKSAKMNDNISSLEDMQAFMERYPDFRSKSINVSKHVAILSELGRLTDICQLLDISALEQEIACNNDHATHKKELYSKFANPRVQNADKLRLALLYLLRYESYNEGREIRSTLATKGISTAQLGLLDSLLEYAGESKRGPGLFSQGGIMAKLTKSITTSINGVQNVYTQHQPVLFHTLDSIFKGKIKDAQFPMISGNPAAKPVEIIVFVVGGATFEEALCVAEYNASNNGYKVILGGSCVHNSTSFLKEISANFSA